MISLRSLLVPVLALLLAWPSPAQADRRAEIAGRGVLRVGTTGDQPPLSYRANPASPFVGLDIEMADLMITDAIETRLQQRLRPALCAVHPETPFDVSHKAYLLFHDAGWKVAVDDWLQPLLEGGEFARRLEHWLDHPWPRRLSVR